MSKELEALNKLFVLSSEYHQKLWCLKLAPVYPEEREKFIDRIVKCLPNDAGELNDLYNSIKEALKLNEPMKPQTETYTNGFFKRRTCSVCGTTIQKEFVYCPRCRQKLDWSNEK